MIRRPWFVVLVAGINLALAAILPAQQPNVHIGYVYPAGGRQGTTFEAIVAGQRIADISDVYVTGQGVKAEIVEIIKPIGGKELNDLRIKIDELMARKAVVKNDFRALEQFRSFKNAKSTKPDAESDKELEALKKKYAGASWTADDDKMLLEVRKKMASGVRKPANPAISELAVLRVTIAPDAESSRRELRIATGQALSNPLVFYVGQLPEFSEKLSKAISEQKSAIAKTMILGKNRKAATETDITLPAVVNGQILPGEIDRFRFTATKGQRLVVAAAARELIPYIPDAVPGWFQATLALYDANGKELAYDDDFRFNPDPVLFYQIPADGQYVVAIKDGIYRGREDFVYRITIGELPFVTSIFPLGGKAGGVTTARLAGWNLAANSMKVDDKQRDPGIYSLATHKQGIASNVVPFKVDSLPEGIEKEANNDIASAQRVTLPTIVNGRINQPDDADVFAFEGRAGAEVVAEVHARRLNSPVDSYLKLTDATGKVLAENDDHQDKGAGLTTHHADSYLRATLPSDGVYYVHLVDAQHSGGPEYAYRLRISAPQPDFALRVVPSSITVRGTSTVPVTIYALRKDGFAGEIALEEVDAPPGVTIRGARVPAGQDMVRVTLTVPPQRGKEPFTLQVQGKATVDGRDLIHAAVPAEDMMQAFEYRHLVPSQELAVAAMGKALATPIRILSDLPLRIPVGGTVQLKITNPFGKYSRQLEMELSDPPAGISIQKVTMSRDTAEIVIQSDSTKTETGLKGNLIVSVLPEKPAASPKSKPQAGARKVVLATLPAIPFEVVKP